MIYRTFQDYRLKHSMTKDEVYAANYTWIEARKFPEAKIRFLEDSLLTKDKLLERYEAREQQHKQRIDSIELRLANITMALESRKKEILCN